jgi:hypothetical protein
VESFGSPPPDYGLSVQSAISLGRPAPGYSQTLRIDLLASGQAAIARYFGEPQATTERQSLATAVAQGFSSQNINLGTGASKVTFDAARVTSGVAVIDASVSVWSRSMTRKPGGGWQTQSSVRMLRYAAIVRHAGGGQWLVVSLTPG